MEQIIDLLTFSRCLFSCFHSVICKTNSKNTNACSGGNFSLYWIQIGCTQNLLRIYKIGKEQAIIFVTTLLATLMTTLTTGIILGILATILVHIIINKSGVLFYRNWLKPNVLMYLEEESGNYYVSVKNFCSFLNFL